MDGMGIDWTAGQFNPVTAFEAAQTNAIDTSQRLNTLHALHGIDLANPDSVQAGVNALARNNALDQAGAVSNLAFQRQMRAQIPTWMQNVTTALRGSGEQSSDTGTGAQPTPDALTQTFNDHVGKTYQLTKTAADQLASAPPEQRAAILNKLHTDLAAQNVPQDAIDELDRELAAQGGPQAVSARYGGLLAHPEGPVAGAMAQLPNNPMSGWAKTLLEHPELQAQIQMIKTYGGPDLTGLIESAHKLIDPTVTQQASVNAAPAMASVDVAKQGALVPVEGAKAGAVARATLPAQIAGKKAEADIAAGHQLVQVDEIGTDGKPTGRKLQYRLDKVLGDGANGAAVGASQSPGEQHGQAADADAFMEAYKRDANHQAIQADITARDTATAAARMAQSAAVHPSALTDWAARNANLLQAFGFDAKQANNLAAYKQFVDTQLKNAIQVFPRNQAEFHAIASAVADAKTPGDAAALSFAMVAAMHDRAAQEKQFRQAWASQHPGEYSETAYQHDASQQAWANRSIFSDPVFQGLSFNGKPVVAISPKSYAGQTWGVFLPGTAQKTAFRVR